MLISTVMMSEHGIKIIDLDGSHIEFDAQDAVDLSQWIDKHLADLFEIIRREERAAKEAARMHGGIEA